VTLGFAEVDAADRVERDLADQRHRRNLAASPGHSLAPTPLAATTRDLLASDQRRGADRVPAARAVSTTRPIGRALRAIREDEQVAAVAGKSVTLVQGRAPSRCRRRSRRSPARSTGIYTSYIAPDFFQPLITIYIFLAVTAGGTGRTAGGVIGAYVLILFLEATRFAADALPGVTPLQAAAAREAAVALALILLLRFRPSGILPETRNIAPRMGDQTP
jgi:hypothetical protein